MFFFDVIGVIKRLHACATVLVLDVIGVVKDVQEIKTIITKAAQKELKKRDIVLVDESQVQVNLTLWGADVRPAIICFKKNDVLHIFYAQF